MLLKCVQCEDRSGYIHKKTWWEITGDAVPHKPMRKTVGEEETRMETRKGRKRKRGMKSLTAVLCECLCVARAKKNKAQARLGIWFQLRAKAGNAAPGGEGCRSTAIEHSSTSTLCKSIYASLLFLFSSGQVHSPSTGLCIFSDFPGLGFRPKKHCLEGITFHTCACLQGEEQWKPGPTCHEKVMSDKSSKDHYLHLDHITSTDGYRIKG